jgi:hypothetical protein
MNFSDNSEQPKQHSTNLLNLINGLSRRYDKRSVFSDFVEMAAISISNAVDATHREFRNTRYIQVAQHYTTEELEHFPKMLAELTMALERGHDVLGKFFHELGLDSKHSGQFIEQERKRWTCRNGASGLLRRMLGPK